MQYCNLSYVIFEEDHTKKTLDTCGVKMVKIMSYIKLCEDSTSKLMVTIFFGYQENSFFFLNSTVF